MILIHSTYYFTVVSKVLPYAAMLIKYHLGVLLNSDPNEKQNVFTEHVRVWQHAFAYDEKGTLQKVGFANRVRSLNGLLKPRTLVPTRPDSSGTHRQSFPSLCLSWRTVFFLSRRAHGNRANENPPTKGPGRVTGLHSILQRNLHARRRRRALGIPRRQCLPIPL